MIAEYSVTLENKTKTELILFIKELQDMLKEKDELYHKALGDLAKADRENIQLKKQIDLMAEIFYKKFKAELLLEYGFEDEEQLKQYFERKVKK